MESCRRNAKSFARPRSPVCLFSELTRIKIGDVLLANTNGRQVLLRRVDRPNKEEARMFAAEGHELPERLSPDRIL